MEELALGGMLVDGDGDGDEHGAPYRVWQPTPQNSDVLPHQPLLADKTRAPPHTIHRVKTGLGNGGTRNAVDFQAPC
jgi:hypothetical protein